MRWSVTSLAWPGSGASRSFEEAEVATELGLRALGHDVVRHVSYGDDLDASRRHVVFGANHGHAVPRRYPPGTVLYNLEQIADGSPWLTPGYVALLRQHEVWDYDPDNAAALRRMGVRATYLPVRFMPEQLPRLRVVEDADVAFYGSVNERRQRVLDQLRAHGLRVLEIANLFGEERDRVVARAKLSLNVHYYGAVAPLETLRVGHLCARGRCVVSEPGRNPDLDRQYEHAVAFSRYEDLVSTCLRLLGNDGERRARASEGRRLHASETTDRVLRTVLETRQETVPVYVVNRNWLTPLRALVDDVRRLGGEPVVVDNESTYPPLLEWYASSPCRIERLGRNVGSRSPWLSGVVDREAPRRYVVTDPDLDISGVPSDAMALLHRGLDKHPSITKAALGLRLDDVPGSYPHRADVMAREGQMRSYVSTADPFFFVAPTDTTFALYERGRAGDHFSGVRARAPYEARHLPWYVVGEPTEEARYYLAHASSGADCSTWKRDRERTHIR